MKSLAIIGLCVAFAIGYGILHDQITIRICPEYFTVFHPQVVDTSNLTVLALVWGVLATWWVGLGLGVLLAWAARQGGRPKREPASLVRPLLVLAAVMAVCACVAGVVGYGLARSGAIVVAPAWAPKIPPHQHVAFLTDLWAHNASYLAGAVGGTVLALRTRRSRRSQP